MKKTGRPVSPHVTIYAFPIAALSSITNRVTGCALSMGCAGLGLVEILGGTGSSLGLVQMVGNDCGWAVAATAKLSISFTMSYHYFGALRHLYWDNTPEVLTNADVEKSSYILFGSAGLVSFVSLFL
jgi:succinate dehydrogenase (ubiquinone) cytochrome b560 subunit